MIQMNIPVLKEVVAPGKMVTFCTFDYPTMWYQTECGFKFPIPLDDTKDASFKKEDRAIFFMRWIRKHIDEITKAQREQGVNSQG